MSEDSKEKVEWNLSKFLIQEIGMLLQRATTLYINGKYARAIECLIAAKMRVIQGMNNDERKAFTSKEKEIRDILIKETIAKMKGDWSPEMEDWIINHRPQTAVLIEEYNTLLMDTLKTLGYTIQLKKDKTNMNA